MGLTNLGNLKTRTNQYGEKRTIEKAIEGTTEKAIVRTIAKSGILNKNTFNMKNFHLDQLVDYFTVTILLAILEVLQNLAENEMDYREWNAKNERSSVSRELLSTISDKRPSNWRVSRPNPKSNLIISRIS